MVGTVVVVVVVVVDVVVVELVVDVVGAGVEVGASMTSNVVGEAVLPDPPPVHPASNSAPKANHPIRRRPAEHLITPAR